METQNQPLVSQCAVCLGSGTEPYVSAGAHTIEPKQHDPEKYPQSEILIKTLH